jgi:hypothetical protein
MRQRERPSSWRCKHHCPIELVRTEGGRRARCLGCGAWGPVHESSQEALRVFRGA